MYRNGQFLSQIKIMRQLVTPKRDAPNLIMHQCLTCAVNRKEHILAKYLIEKIVKLEENRTKSYFGSGFACSFVCLFVFTFRFVFILFWFVLLSRAGTPFIET